MKNLIVALSLLTLPFAAQAEQTVVLNLNSLVLASQDSGAAQLDLSKELQRQAPGTNLSGQRLKSITVTGNSAALGATAVLVVSGRALDSQTSQSANSNMTLVSNTGSTPGSWVLAVRGQLAVQQIVMTLDVQSTINDEFNFDRGDRIPKAIAVEEPGNFSLNQNLFYVDPNNKVFKVSVYKMYPDGTVGVAYQGREYYVKNMLSLAIMTGCTLNAEACVGDPVTIRVRDGSYRKATVVGIQNDDYLIITTDGVNFIGNWPSTAIIFQ